MDNDKRNSFGVCWRCIDCFRIAAGHENVCSSVFGARILDRGNLVGGENYAVISIVCGKLIE